MSYLAEHKRTSDELIAELEADFYWVRCDRTSSGAYRVRIERHSGRTFPDYRATTTSTASMEIAVQRAYLKVRDAETAGEIEPARAEFAAACLARMKAVTA